MSQPLSLEQRLTRLERQVAGLVCASRTAQHGRATSPRQSSAQRIAVAAAEVAGVSLAELRQRCRKPALIYARRLAIIALDHYGLPLETIGDTLSLHHTTVGHHLQRAELLRKTDPRLAADFDDVLERLGDDPASPLTHHESVRRPLATVEEIQRAAATVANRRALAIAVIRAAVHDWQHGGPKHKESARRFLFGPAAAPIRQFWSECAGISIDRGAARLTEEAA